MATPAQIAANQANAQRSTGPKTQQGKLAASQNALKHGILAQVIPSDTPGYQEILQGLYKTLAPMDEIQRLLVDQIATSIIRLQRALSGEQSFLTGNGRLLTDQGWKPAPPLSFNDYLGCPEASLAIRYESAINRLIQRNLRLIKDMKSNYHWHSVRAGSSPYNTPSKDESEPSSPSSTQSAPSTQSTQSTASSSSSSSSTSCTQSTQSAPSTSPISPSSSPSSSLPQITAQRRATKQRIRQLLKTQNNARPKLGSFGRKTVPS